VHLTFPGVGILAVYEKFSLELKCTYESFISKIETDCRQRLKDDFVMFTKIVDWDILQQTPGNESTE
jgi:hypothetical protein